jgi:negative regulator of flagellin synthesis FlgM
MKIDNSVKSSGSVAGESKTRSTREAPASTSSASSEKVQLSSLSNGMQQLEQAIASTTVVDSGKVDEIKQAIAQGQFQVHPDKVADGLIESVRQMLSAQQPHTA